MNLGEKPVSDLEVQTDGETLTERAMRLLHQEIMSGTLKPGERMAVTELSKRYGISSSPMREALSRLAERNMVVALGRRGFRVRELSYEDLSDITRVRFLVEREALQISMSQAGDIWEASVIAALHRLRRNVQNADTEFGHGGEEFDRLHHEFHAALIAGCESPRLVGLAHDLFDQAFRYRQIMMRVLANAEHEISKQPITNAQSFIEMHETLAEAVLERKHELAFELLHRHLNSTLRNVYPEKVE